MISFKNFIFLNEGLIKLPTKMFKDGETKIVSDVCSYMVTETSPFKDDPEVNRFIEHVKKTASKYSAPLRFLKKKTRSKFKIEVSISDLPKKYQDAYKGSQLLDKEGKPYDWKLELDLDWKQKGRLSDKAAGGFYQNTEAGKIVVGLGSITELDLKKKLTLNRHNVSLAKMDKPSYRSRIYDELKDAFDRGMSVILQTFEHELTHYVQFKFLKPLHATQVETAGRSFKSLQSSSEEDKYYGSQVEFDPTIRTEIGRYHRQEKDNVESKLKGTRSEWMKVFTGAKAIPKSTFSMIRSEKHGGFVEPSKFFLSLKKNNPDKWKKAIKLFTQEIERRYPL